MRIGLIGVGNIGGTLANKFAAAGHEVWLANSRGAQSLHAVASEIGGIATDLKGATASADVVIISVPFKAFATMPADLFAVAPAGQVVIDTGNYYPMRDGTIAGLDADLSDSEWVARQIGKPVIKAFNSIAAKSLIAKGTPHGADTRVALPVAGDDASAKAIACRLVDDAGFEPVDAGPLAQSWRQQPGTGAYTTDLDAHHLRIALARLTDGDRALLPLRREENLKLILSLPEGPGSAQSIRALRAQWDLPEDIEPLIPRGSGYSSYT